MSENSVEGSLASLLFLRRKSCVSAASLMCYGLITFSLQLLDDLDNVLVVDWQVDKLTLFYSEKQGKEFLLAVNKSDYLSEHLSEEVQSFNFSLYESCREEQASWF